MRLLAWSSCFRRRLARLGAAAPCRSPRPCATRAFSSCAARAARSGSCRLGEPARAALAAYLDRRAHFLREGKASRFLFPSRGRDGHLTRRRCGQLLKELALEAGLDPARLSPHVLRHAFASHLSSAAPICAACRRCSAMPTSRRRRSIRMCRARGCNASLPSSIRSRAKSPRVNRELCGTGRVAPRQRLC